MTAFRVAVWCAVCLATGEGLRAAAQKSVDVPLPPTRAEQAKLLDEVRDYAINYTRRLPDFICLEQTRRYEDPAGRQAWRPVDVLTARLSYFNQKEDYKLISQNGRAVTDLPYASIGGAFSVGDFGTSMRTVFDPASHATFAWKRWATLRGRRAHVFSYRVPPEYSTYMLRYEGDEGRDAESQDGLSRLGLRGRSLEKDRAHHAGATKHAALVSHHKSRGNAGLRFHQDRRKRVLSAASGELGDGTPRRVVHQEREGIPASTGSSRARR